MSYLAGFMLWALAAFLALRFGAVSGMDTELIFQLRLPRVLLATAVGIGLSVAGAALQALFTNPLCEPYTLGISSGSALGAVIGISLGLELDFSGLLGSSFAGALAFAFALQLVSMKPGTGNLTVLLSGVMLGLFGSSLVTVWMALADPQGIQAALGWLLGDLSRARPNGALFSLVGAIVFSALVWLKSPQLDALLMGEEGAASLGVSVRSTRTVLLLVTSLLVGICVSAAGIVGFVGLIVPHFARRLCGALHHHLLPLSAIWGATTVVASDLLARTVASPIELPVGVVTALVGVPIFLWMMLKRGEVAS